MYNTQLEQNMANLTELLFSLYGKRWDFYQIMNRLEKIMSDANKSRDKSLLKLDKEAVAQAKDGKDFWYHLTGDLEFYDDLISAFAEVADEMDSSALLQQTIDRLAFYLDQISNEE